MRTTVQLGLALCVGLVACRPADVAGTDAAPITFAPGDPVWGLTGAQRNLFGHGRLVFGREFTPETGLGPLFNSTSCAECHAALLAGGPGDQVPDRADPDDQDDAGISGPPNRTADGRVGRFGRKANFATLREFNSGAFLAEQGITNPEAPAEGTIGGAAIPPGVDPVGDPE